MEIAAPGHLVTGRRRGRRSWPRRLRRAALVLVAVIAVIGTVFGLQYRRQIVSYLTHLKGSPTNTDPYVPFPADDLPTLRVAAAGDVGDSGDRLGQTAAAMARLGADDPYDVLLLLGDNVYPAGDPERLDETVFRPFERLLDRGATLLAILGNHDVMGGEGDTQMEALGMPGRWWSVERDGVLFIGLDSNRPFDHDQRDWLEDTLRSTTATWRIVALHHSPYSAGYQGSSEDAREQFSPLFERYGVQLVVSGHDHDYQRSEPINGVT